MILERFVMRDSATALVRALHAETITRKQGRLINTGYVCKLLNNRVYIGQAVHRSTAYPVEHQATISQSL